MSECQEGSMRARMGRQDWLVLWFGVAALYLLAPTLDRGLGFLVSLAFALILILASRMVWDQRHVGRYGAYILIAVVTYYILFCDQPWRFFLDGGMYESSAVPLVVCSMIMSLAGGLLLARVQDRVIYVLITLGLQAPIGLMVGAPRVQEALTSLADLVHYHGQYSGSWQAWQFEWMLTYYLPIFFLSRRDKRR